MSSKKEDCLNSSFTKKLSSLERLIPLFANPPKALYRDAGKFFVSKTIVVLTFLLEETFFCFFENTKNLVILFFLSWKFFLNILSLYIFAAKSDAIAPLDLD